MRTSSRPSGAGRSQARAAVLNVSSKKVMTNYYEIEAEVAGGWGQNTVADTSVHPPNVHALHYEFAGWLGDELLETFPCFIVSERLGKALEQSGLTGYILADVEVSVSEAVIGSCGGQDLPRFEWLKITGSAGNADFGLSKGYTLVVSEQALAVLRRFPISNAEVSLWSC